MTIRKRNMPAWLPVWNSNIEKWTSKQIKANLWRCDHVNDFDDLMQEAQILFWRLGKTYPIVNEPSHFFALYKTALLRTFTDKARTKQKTVACEAMPVEEAAASFESNLKNYGYLNVLLSELPSELKLVLNDLTSGRIRLRLDRPTAAKRHRENLNMRLKRRIPQLTLVDPVGDLKRVLKYN